MLNVSDQRRLHQQQCGRGGASAEGRVVVVPATRASQQSSSATAVVSPQSLAALRVSRKYRRAAVRRREYRKLKAIVPAVCAKHTVSKVRISYGKPRAENGGCEIAGRETNGRNLRA